MEKRILQTNASSQYQGAVLLDENKNRVIYEYQSVKFKEVEQHYHSTFKEILVVKKVIEKFQFHLVGKHFLIEMDMLAFPTMLKAKKTMVEQPQLIRCKNWFEQQKFDVKQVKGKRNILPNFLSRLAEFNPESTQTILLVFMMLPGEPSNPPSLFP